MLKAPVRAGDMATIATRMDYLGINYYFRSNIRSDGAHGYVEEDLPNVERTQMGWEVYPDGLRDLLLDFKHRYPGLPPIYITENGMASDDTPVAGRVADEQRLRYLNRHVAAVDQAMRQGVDVRLLRVVPAGQLRVGVRLREALRTSSTSTTTPRSARRRTAHSR